MVGYILCKRLLKKSDLETMCVLGKNKYFKENLSCMLLKMIKFIGYEPIYLKNPPSSLQDEAEISSVVYR